MHPYNRENPSPRYQDLLKMYAQMHDGGSMAKVGENTHQLTAKATFPGNELPKFADHIAGLIRETGSASVLDYGSGKGLQYDPQHVIGQDGKEIDICKKWGIDRDNVSCFDPGVPAFNTLPDGPFDAVVSTDVLEHISREDVFWVIEEMFARANKFVFCSIACYPAKTLLPDGTNAHVTIMNPYWWIGIFESMRARHPHLRFSLALIAFGRTPLDEPQLQTTVTPLIG